MILDRLVVGPLEANCYLVGSEATKEGMIIDPGEEADKILTGVKKLGLTIKSIVLTHGHIDHVGALSGVKEATGAELCLHPGDRSVIEVQPLAGFLGTYHPTLPNIDRWLSGGDSIEIGDLHFLVIHTPGHTPGSICLLGHGILFTGDTLFNHGIGRTDLPGGSYSQLMDSLHTKLLVLPDDTTVYPGHGPETTIGKERRANPFLHG